MSMIRELIKGTNLDDDLDRKKAFHKCVEYAENKLKDNSEYNHFVSIAAKTLRQPAIVKNISESIQTRGDEKLYLSYSPSHGPELCGNEPGLSFLSHIFGTLSRSKMDGEHVHLYAGEEPLYGNSYPLTIFKEGDQWFEEHAKSKEMKPEEPIRQRNLSPSEIKALLFPVPIPPSELITQNKIYKVIRVEKYRNQKVWEKRIRESNDRMFVFSFLDDGGKPASFAFDLDDEAIFLFTGTDLQQLSS